MDGKKFNYFLLALTAIGSFLWAYVGIADAAQCFIVNISKENLGGKSAIYLYPDELKVPRGSCVVWVSWVQKQNVNINFHANSKSCIHASESRTGFMEVEGCFFSEFLEYGQTVSLYFKEAGVFSYRLELLEKVKESGEEAQRIILREGKIIVD